MTDNRVPLTVALASYDHTYAITSGDVQIGGVDAAFVELPVPAPERFLGGSEWDLAELSAVDYVVRRAAGEDDVVALPVFTSRLFRHRSILVRRDRVSGPEQLRGARVGIPSWATATAVYARGLLADMHGVQAADVRWVQAGLDSALGTGPPAVPYLPAEVELATDLDRTLAELLLAGDVDAVVAAPVPAAIRAALGPDGVVAPLFETPGESERAYYARTSVLPITHLLGVRRDLLERYRWLASNVYRSFEVARRRYFARVVDIGASRLPVPWANAHLQQLHQTFGPDVWAYGVDANRPSLEALVRYCVEQGVIAPDALGVDDLFAAVEPFVDGM